MISSLLLAPTQKTPSQLLKCEAFTPGLNVSKSDAKTVEIFCKLAPATSNLELCLSKCLSLDAPEARIILGGSLNISNIVEFSDIYFECM